MFLIPLALVGWPALASAHEGGARGKEASAHHDNVLGIKGIFAVHLLEDRASAAPDLEAPERDRLGGFELSYQRVLVREWLALEVAKPFLFGPGRYDSPLDASFKVMRRWGDVEPFLAAGTTFNVRVFAAEREEIEGRSNALSFGVIGATGAAFYLGETTALEVELGAAHILAGPVVDNELNAAAGFSFAF